MTSVVNRFLFNQSLTLDVRCVLKKQQLSLNSVAFDNQPTYDLVVLSNLPKNILTHDIKGWKHIVYMYIQWKPVKVNTSGRENVLTLSEVDLIHRHIVKIFQSHVIVSLAVAVCP